MDECSQSTNSFTSMNANYNANVGRVARHMGEPADIAGIIPPSARRSPAVDKHNRHVARDLLPVPPDGGYGWVVVMACFMCNGIVEGSVGSFGIFLPHFAEAFKTTTTKATIAGSLLIGGFLISGVVVSSLINLLGCRIVTMMGGAVTTLAFALSTVCPNINMFIFVYGLIGGFGLGMIYLPAMVMVGYYFERHRPLATGIAYSGAGAGMLVMAPVAGALLAAYDWKNALLLFAAFPVQSMAFGILMRPLSAKQHHIDEKVVSDTEEVSKKLIREPKKRKTSSLPKINIEEIIFETECLKPIDDVGLVKSQSLFTIPIRDNDITDQRRSVRSSKTVSKTCSLLSQSCIELSSIKLNKNRENKPHKPFISCKELDQLPDDFLAGIDMEKIRDEILKPLARCDVLYTGSIKELPEYNRYGNMLSYMASVTQIPYRYVKRGEDVTRPSITLTKLIDRLKSSLFFHPQFVIICVGSIFIQLGYFIPIVFISDYAVSLGTSEQNAATLISIVGLANIIGRAGSGALANVKCVNTLHLNNLCLVAAGVVTLFVYRVCTTFVLLSIYAFAFGLLMGAFVPVITIFIVKYLGLHCLNNAMGLLSMVRGLSSMAGPPIAGYLLDVYGSHEPIFYFAGAMFIMAGCVFYLIPVFAKYFTKEEKSASNAEVPVYNDTKKPVL